MRSRILLALGIAVPAGVILGRAILAEDLVSGAMGGLLIALSALLALSGLHSRGDRHDAEPIAAGLERVPLEKPSPLLGELLVERHDIVTKQDLERALAEQRGTTQRLGEILIERGLITQAQIEMVLQDQRSWPSPWRHVDPRKG